MKTVAFLCLLTTAIAAADEPKSVLLWPNGAPGSEGKTAAETTRVTQDGEHVVANVHQPSITPYLPSKETATGAAVVIAPGGGHREMWMDHEGYNIAKWLSAHGVAAFVLKYRLAREQGSTYTIEGASLADTQRAIRLVRKNAAEWGVNPDRVGVMGFSAGGELAALAAARYHAVDSAAPDAIDRLSDKPSFQGLIYPAIPADMKLSKETPAAFLVCGENDRQNISQGLPQLYLQMKQAGVSAELHVYAGVGHGFGLRDRTRGAVAGWVSRFHEWLDGRGFLKRQAN
jgi:acetyl esterase/lipase